MKEKVCHF